MDAQMTFKRYELKYMLTGAQAEELKDAIKSFTADFIKQHEKE